MRTSTGTIVITAPTGAGLTYSIDGVTNYVATTTFAGLTPNTYDVTVRDAGGCTSAATSLTVNAPAAAPGAPTPRVRVEPTSGWPPEHFKKTEQKDEGFIYIIEGVHKLT